jgi:hypothetical protein
VKYVDEMASFSQVMTLLSSATLESFCRKWQLYNIGNGAIVLIKSFGNFPHTCKWIIGYELARQ